LAPPAPIGENCRRPNYEYILTPSGISYDPSNGSSETSTPNPDSETPTPNPDSETSTPNPDYDTPNPDNIENPTPNPDCTSPKPDCETSTSNSQCESKKFAPIVVLGAGPIGSGLIEELHGHNYKVRLVYFDTYESEGLDKTILDDSYSVDIYPISEIEGALQGCTTLFFPNTYSQNISQNDVTHIFQSAKQAGIEKVVKFSICAYLSQGGLAHEWHKHLDAQIKKLEFQCISIDSNIPFESLFLFNREIIPHKLIAAPFPEDFQISYVSAKDIIRICAHSLMNHEKLASSYVVAGPETLSFTRVLEIINSHLGNGDKVFSYYQRTLEEAKENWNKLKVADFWCNAWAELLERISTRQNLMAECHAEVYDLFSLRPTSLAEWLDAHPEKISDFIESGV